MIKLANWKNYCDWAGIKDYKGFAKMKKQIALDDWLEEGMPGQFEDYFSRLTKEYLQAMEKRINGIQQIQERKD